MMPPLFRMATCAAALMLAPPALAGEPASCDTPPALSDLGQPLPRVAARLAARQPVTVVALGSSSTSGAGASSPERTYPRQLARLWPSLVGGGPVTIHNRGIGGQDVDEMVRRLRSDVIDLKPDLVLWQLGTNAVLRSDGVGHLQALIGRHVTMLRDTGTDVVLIDLQYAPKVLADPDHGRMQSILATVAGETGSGLFGRFAAMKFWFEDGQTRRGDILAPDGLHLNDRGYLCWAEALARGIGRAVRIPEPGTAISSQK